MLAPTTPAAALLLQGQRLLALDRHDDAFRGALWSFLDRLTGLLDTASPDFVRVLPLRAVADRGFALEQDQDVRASIEAWAAQAGSGAGASGKEPADSARPPATRVLPFFCLKLILEEDDRVAQAVMAFTTQAIGEEADFFELPPSARTRATLESVGRELERDLARRLSAIASEEFRIRAALLVRRLVGVRPRLRFLFHARPSTVEGSDDPRSGAHLALMAIAPVRSIAHVEKMFADPMLRTLLFEALAGRSEQACGQDDLESEIDVRRRFAECLLREVQGALSESVVTEVWRLASAAAPRNYSASTDYAALQRARSAVYDALLRLTRYDVDDAGAAPVAGRIGLIVSSLAPSAEMQAIKAHYRALERAGGRPVVVLWPHFTGDVAVPDAEAAGLAVLDLAQVGLDERIEAVRACGFDCLMFMNNLTWGWSEYILAAAMRLARVQIATYLSVVTVGLKNVDYYLVGEESEGGGAAHRYLEQLCQIEGSVLCFPAVAARTPTSASGRGRKPTIACGSSLPKLTPAALDLAFAVARDLDAERAIFYPFNPAWGATVSREVALSYLQEFAELAGFEPDRVQIVGPWDTSEEIGKLLARSDLYVDSFPHSGGLSVLDAIGAGVPVVYRVGDQQRSLQAANVVALTGAPALAVGEDGRPDPAALQALVSSTDKARPDLARIGDLDDFGRRLKGGLESIGVFVVPDSADWIDTLTVEGADLLKVGATRTLVSSKTPGAGRGAIAWVGDRAGAPAGSKTVPLNGGMATAKLHREEASSCIVGFTVGEGAEGAQVALRVGGAVVARTPVLGPGAQSVLLVTPFDAGWNLLDLTLESPGGDALVTISDLRAAGETYAPQAPLEAKWRALDGFSLWEPARRPLLGSAFQFRWCVGPLTSISVDIDVSDCVGLELELRVADVGQVVRVIHLGEVVGERSGFTGRLWEIDTLAVEAPLTRGEHRIDIECDRVDALNERPLTFILTGVRLLRSAGIDRA